MVHVATAREAALEAIRNSIMSGRLKPGERLNVDRIAKEVGVSHVPIREALGTLEAEGLITVLPHRGAYVAELSSADLQELYLVRIRLETLAARLGTERITSGELAQMSAVLDRMAGLAKSGDLEGLLDANRAFHFQLYEASRVKRLCQLLEKLWDNSGRYIRAYVSDSGDREKSLHEHRQIYAGCLVRDPGQVEAWLVINLSATRDYLLSQLEAAERSRRTDSGGPGVDSEARAPGTQRVDKSWSSPLERGEA